MNPTVHGRDRLDGLSEGQRQARTLLQGALFEAAADGIIGIDRQGLVLLFNPAAERLFGYSAAEVLGRNVAMLMPERQAGRHDAQIAAYLHGEGAQAVGGGRDVEGRRKNGELFSMHLSLGRVDLPGGPAFVGICHDLGHYKQALRRLHHLERRYRDILDSETELIVRLDAGLRVILSNPALARFLGESEERLLGRRLLEFVHPADRLRLRRAFRALCGEGGGRQLQARMQSVEREPRWIEWRVRALVGEGGQREFQCFGLDVSDHVEAREQAQYLASHDRLTGLRNRASLAERMEELLARGGEFALLHINLDRFKLINESLGHGAGDQVLKVAAARIGGLTSGRALAARLGADEFAVLVECASVGAQTQLNGLGQQILAMLSEPYVTSVGAFNLTASLGICCAPLHGDRHEQLLQRAETAMQIARTRGRNELVCFTPELEQQLPSAELELELRRALAEDGFELYFQPKYFLADGALQGMEVLLRWFHPEWGAVSPASFIPVAEAHGLARPLGEWVLRRTCAQIRSWQAQGLQVPVLAVNLSARQFEGQALHEQLLAILADYGVAPAQIELEITEDAALSNTEELLGLLNQLRAEGFSIAIDDFGTGYSSLSYLTHLPASTLKIDRAFINRIKEDTRRDSVVEAVIGLGHLLGMLVVAEGVENEVQVEFLRSAGCDVVQGFHFARPMDAARAGAVLQAVRQPAPVTEP